MVPAVIANPTGKRKRASVDRLKIKKIMARIVGRTPKEHIRDLFHRSPNHPVVKVVTMEQKA
jgi:hypothetical protein